MPPGNPPPYGPPPSGPSGPYPPPPPPPPPYSAPTQGYYPPPPGYYGPPPKKTRWGLIIGPVAGAIALVAVAAVVLVVIVGKGTVTATDVKVGDCLAEIPDSARVLTVKTVECDQSHAGEVYAELTMPDGDYPGAP